MDLNSGGFTKHDAQKSVSSDELGHHLLDVEQCRQVFEREHKKLIVCANRRFGVDSWSHSVTKLETDCVDCIESHYSVAASAIVKLELKKGLYHEEVGYGFSFGMKNKAISIANARQEAKLDAFKRALDSFCSDMDIECFDADLSPMHAHTSVHKNDNTSPITVQSEVTFKTPTSKAKVAFPVGSHSEKEQNDLRAERKRKQQKLQEEYRLRMKLKEQQHPPSKENINDHFVNDSSVDDEPAFLSTQELDEVMKSAMVPTKSVVPPSRMPLISSPRWGSVSNVTHAHDRSRIFMS